MGGILGGSGGGGSTSQTTTSQQGPPQINPYALPGFISANQYYQNLLANPATQVYPGPRIPLPSDNSLAAIQNAQSLYGGGPTALNQQGGATLSQIMAGQQPIGAPALPGAIAAPTVPGGISPNQFLFQPPSPNVNAPQIQLPPNSAAAIASMAQPIMAQFEQQVIPGITSRADFAGQGPTSTREQAATKAAEQNLGQAIATGAIAPIYQTEAQAAMEQAQLGEQASQAQAQIAAQEYATQAGQGANIFGTQVGQQLGLGQLANSIYGQQIGQNLGLGSLANQQFGTQVQQQLGMTGEQLNAVSGVLGLTQDQMSQFGMLMQTGQLDQALQMLPLQTAQQIFQEPGSIQSQAAQALINAAIAGGGSSTATSQGSQNPGVMGTITQLASIAAIAAMFMSSEKFKRDIEYLRSPDYLSRMRETPLAEWNYRWEPAGSPRHTGPIVEYSSPTYRVGDWGINPLWYAGELHAAMKQLDQKVSNLEARSLYA